MHVLHRLVDVLFQAANTTSALSENVEREGCELAAELIDLEPRKEAA